MKLGLLLSSACIAAQHGLQATPLRSLCSLRGAPEAHRWAAWPSRQQLCAMARQGGNLHHEKPPRRCDTRRNSYETGARGSQRVIVW